MPIFDAEAYLQGRDAYNEYLETMIYPGNPYDEGSDEWSEWNEGWNSKELC